jgi:hypothetical protein
MVMEGSYFSILPLLILLFLASPAIIPNFSVMLFGENWLNIGGISKMGAGNACLF